MAIDGRGRLRASGWLRDAVEPDDVLLVGSRIAATGGPVVLLAPPWVLDDLADTLAGEQQ